MKTIFISLIILIFPAAAHAHPLDMSFTTLQYRGNVLYGTAFLHPYEIALLASDYHVPIEKISFEQLKELIIPYFRTHFKIFDRNGSLSFSAITLQEAEMYEIIASGGYILFTMEGLERKQFPVSFNVDLFHEYFTTQTNKLVVLDEQGGKLAGSEEIFLTVRIKTWTWDIDNPDFSMYRNDLTDTDKDGLSDKFESYYGMNPRLADTDGDGLTDYDEFQTGTDPLKAGTGGSNNMNLPGASTFTRPPETSGSRSSSGGADSAALRNLIREHSVANTATPDTGFLEQTLASMKKFFSGKYTFYGLYVILLSVFALGFLHGAMPGHGKGILLAFLAEKDRKFLHALGFVSTFTFTHLIDVVILSFGFSIFASSTNSSKITEIMRLIGGVGLFGIAVFLIVRNIMQLVKKKTVQTKTQAPDAKSGWLGGKVKKSAFLLGILTGLAPCPFGWAILMMLLALGKLDMVPVIIIAFGLGIFCFMLCMTVVILLFKKIAQSLFARMDRVSGLVSGGLLLVFAVLFFIPQWNIF